MPELMLCKISVNTKKEVLKKISLLAHAIDARVKQSDILESLTVRERLGSTNIGYGIAIPHARIKNLNSVLCILITLADPISFDGEKEEDKIDIIFGLLVPEEATQMHLNILAQLAERLQDPLYRQHLRTALTVEELYETAKKDD